MNNLFHTSDTSLATAIVASGLSVYSMKREPDGKVYFYFSDLEQAQKLTKRFWCKTLQVDAQTMIAEFKTLKQRIALC